ncbi:MAG TPA: hypothetical protein VIW29_20945 [Polyangiaceae bacterium]
MRADTLVTLGLLGAALGCGGTQATIGSSVGERVEEQGVPSPAVDNDADAAAGAPGRTDAPSQASAGSEPPPEPPPDPALVKALLAKTGESSPVDNPLHVRLEVTPRPQGEQWLAVVVNRGTERASVDFDLRRLSIELETPEDPQKPRPKWKKKPAPLVCKLPAGFGGASAAQEPARVLEPGQGLLHRFDPRLYCISPNGDAMLAKGQVATVKLGVAPKPPRVVWKQGKKTEQPAPQSAPFVAEPALESSAEPAKTPDPEHDPRVKQLVATPFELTPELLGGEAEEDPALPLALRLVRGSDAASERTATALVEVRAKRKKQVVYFRRELVSFTVHGPDGVRGCDPQPDDRAPDRQAYSTLGPGRAVSATGLLAELCPNATFARPGLYLLSASFEAERDGAEFGMQAFTGRLDSRRQALVRIRVGDRPALPAPEPMLIRVGE